MPTPEVLLHKLDLTLTDQGFTVEVDERLCAVDATDPAASRVRQVVRQGGKDDEPYWFDTYTMWSIDARLDTCHGAQTHRSGTPWIY